MGRDSSVGIAIRYGLDDPGIESRWGEIIRTRPDRPCVYRLSLQEVKRTGRGVDHTPPSSAQINDRISAISLLPLCDFMAYSRVKFTFTHLLYLPWCNFQKKNLT